MNNRPIPSVAIDVMGGETGFENVLKGAYLAYETVKYRPVFVGDEFLIKDYIIKIDPDNSMDAEIIHAPKKIEMSDLPVWALLKKEESSLHKAFKAVKEGRADSVVSAGNSGAIMTIAIRILGRLEGINRPGLAATIPTVKGRCVLIDIGANVDCKAINLYQFAIMGSEFAKAFLGITRPRVAILSNGEEASKGNSVTKKAAYLLKRHSLLDFKGYIEGHEIFNGEADVIVCDGFVGNILLKTMEGLVSNLVLNFKKNIFEFFGLGIDPSLLVKKGGFENFFKEFDYNEYGGVPLLGINGKCIIAHGRSNERAMKNAILSAIKYASLNLNLNMERKLL